MDYLSGLTNYITGQDQLESSTSVDSLLLRLESVVRPHEKEQTVEDLAQAVQGRPDKAARALPIVLALLHGQGQETPGVRTACLEFIANAVVFDERKMDRNEGQRPEELQRLATNNMKIAAQDETLELMLISLQDPDFYPRYFALKILGQLLSDDKMRVQELFLGHPDSMSTLLDLLIDGSEVLRNETLLFLRNLHDIKPELQQIIVFGTAFERLLSIAGEVDDVEPAVRSDTLAVVTILLQNNSVAQNYFRDMGLVTEYARVFEQTVESCKLPGALVPSPQLQMPLLQELHILALILRPVEEKQREKAQDAVTRTGLMTSICQLAIGRVWDSRIKSHALYCLSLLVCGRPETSAALFEVSFPGVGRFLDAVLQNQMVHKNTSLSLVEERAMLSLLVQSMTRDNSQLQLQLASTFTTMIQEGEDILERFSFGRVVTSSLLSLATGAEVFETENEREEFLLARSSRRSLAARIVESLVYENEDVKVLLMRLPLEISDRGEPMESLLPRLLRVVQEKEVLTGRGGENVLRLLYYWLRGSSTVCSVLSKNPALLVKFAEIVKDPNLSRVSGLVCSVLATVVSDLEDHSAELVSFFKSNIGITRFVDVLEGLTRDSALSASLKQKKNLPPSPPLQLWCTLSSSEQTKAAREELPPIFDRAFAMSLKETSDKVSHRLLALYSAATNESGTGDSSSSPVHADMEALQLQLSVLKDQKEKIENELRGDVQRLSQKVESLEKNLAEAEREREFADSQLRECQQRLRQAEEVIDSHQDELAQKESETEGLIAEHEMMEKELERLREECEELRMHAATSHDRQEESTTTPEHLEPMRSSDTGEREVEAEDKALVRRADDLDTSQHGKWEEERRELLERVTQLEQDNDDLYILVGEMEEELEAARSGMPLSLYSHQKTNGNSESITTKQ